MNVGRLLTVLVVAGCISGDPAVREQHEADRTAVAHVRAVEAAQAQRDADSVAEQQRQQDSEMRAAREASELRHRERDQAKTARKQQSEAALAECQAKLDTDLDAGISCWDDGADSWSDLGVTTRTVKFCLLSEQDRVKTLRVCVAKPETTDGDILAKKECLEALRRPVIVATAEMCAPLKVDAFDSKLVQDTGYEAVVTRVRQRAVDAQARFDQRAADARARAARCNGDNALSLVLKLRVDSSITATSVKGCTYSIVGTVATTTKDGWAIVEFSPDFAAAFKSNTRYVDGSYVRTDGAAFIGVRSFERVDGGSANIAAFTATK